MTQTPPVNFEDHVFPIVRIAANPNFSPTKDPIIDGEVDSQLSINAVPDAHRRFMAELRVKLLPKDTENLPYFIDVVGITFLNVNDDVPDEAVNNTAAIAGHLILYPAIRELILSITSRQPWGKFSIGLSVLSGGQDGIAQMEQPVKKKPSPQRKRSQK